MHCVCIDGPDNRGAFSDGLGRWSRSDSAGGSENVYAHYASFISPLCCLERFEVRVPALGSLCYYPGTDKHKDVNVFRLQQHAVQQRRKRPNERGPSLVADRDGQKVMLPTFAKQ